MKKQKGFSLIEILLVIAIIGILTVVLIPNIVAARGRSYQVAIDSCGKAIIYAQELYKMDNDSYSNSYADLSQDAVRPCISTGTLSITDGAYGQNDYWLVESSAGGKARQVDAAGVRYN